MIDREKSIRLVQRSRTIIETLGLRLGSGVEDISLQ
jgi:hypothetical protein